MSLRDKLLIGVGAWIVLPFAIVAAIWLVHAAHRRWLRLLERLLAPARRRVA